MGSFMHFLHSKNFSGALFALVVSCGAAQASVIPVDTYSMQNGDGILQAGTFNYLDKPYSNGNGTTPQAPLSGGTGILTDGVAPHENWSNAPNGYVAWKYFNPTITFNFAAPATVGELDIYVSGNTGGLDGFPAAILVNGNPVSISAADWGWGYDGVQKLSIIFGSSLPTSQVIVQLLAGPAQNDALNYPYPNDPFIIDPRTNAYTTVEPWLMVSEVQFLSAVPEPSTWIMMILGFGTLAFVSFRKSQKALNLATV